MLKKSLAIAPYIFCSVISFFPNVAVAQTVQSCRLGEDIAGVLTDEKFSQAQWGIAVQDLEHGELAYGHNADTLFVPASNVKLFTTAVALEKLQLDYQFTTSIYGVGDAPNLEILIVKGGGDPSFTSEKLQELARTLKSQQISSINQVVIDDSLFQESVIHPTWEWSDLAFYYAPSANSVILDENAVVISLTPSTVGQTANLQTFRGENSEAIALSQWDINNQLITSEAGTKYIGRATQTIGTNELTITGQIPLDRESSIWGLSIPNPAENFRDQLLANLGEEGIQVDTSTITNTGFEKYDEANFLTATTSPILSKIIATTNQDSNNIYAESLRHILGTSDSEKTGSQVITETLVELGVTESSFVRKDGSGLSRHNLASPQSFVELLSSMADHPDAVVYKSSLAITGESGTLTRRFVDTRVAGNFYGKTGTMTNVVTLSGYLDVDGDRTLALSILVNQSPQPASVTRQGMDEIVQTIYHWGSDCLGAISTDSPFEAR